ncbi:hypothetical protein C8F04DRAFT_1276311 [Mycena alexandri]|uniref:Uncharacterized protein n=1 Tax=Mycena alexandri TaxID=1745969 RepID=A0AAD6S1B1_9AGAR|nr:hypothetical protein C8F04DRAFT_1276311 [Mycena alexandri]
MHIRFGIIGGITEDELKEDDSNMEWVNHPREAKIFLSSMKAQNIGGDLAAMGSDVRRLMETGTVRTTTWAQKGKKASAKYTRNTMGVHIP